MVQEFRQNKAEKAVNLGLVTNFFLAIIKIAVGITSHSQALLADGINSTSDVAYYIIIKIFVRLSGKPADPEHPYGHHQFESISALVVGAFVITTGVAIFWDSVNSSFTLLTHPESVQPLKSFALWIALLTIVIKIALMLYTNAIGKIIRNPAISALARDHRNDIFASLGAAIGISLGLLGFPWFDPMAGAVVAIIVLRTGFDILRESSSELMDAVPGDMLNLEIRKNLAPIHEIKEIEELQAHRFGPYFVINITIGINGDLTVTRGDEIATEVERLIIDKIEMVRRVYVHYHPASRT